jgi:arylsulfatase
LEQRAHGLEVWRDPPVPQRVPKIFDIRADPFERADIESGAYERWFIDRAFLLVPAQAVVAQFLATFRDFPPRQKPASFSVDQALEAMQKASAGRD